MSSLIIMSCSKTKKPLEQVRAIDLYDGQAFRIIKKHSPGDLEILIISAKYGIIHSKDIISHYDQVMTVSKAIELRDEVEKETRRITKCNRTEKVFLYLGHPYNLSISKELMSYLDEYLNLQTATGPIGKRLHQLKEWLESIKEVSKW